MKVGIFSILGRIHKGIQSWIHETDPRLRIRLKMKGFHNTDIKFLPESHELRI